MAARQSIRGPSSPDLGQERPNDRLRPGSVVDLGVRDDVRDVAAGGRPPVRPAAGRGQRR